MPASRGRHGRECFGGSESLHVLGGDRDLVAVPAATWRRRCREAAGGQVLEDGGGLGHRSHVGHRCPGPFDGRLGRGVGDVPLVHGELDGVDELPPLRVRPICGIRVDVDLAQGHRIGVAVEQPL
jgi:hypothetical protein